MEILTTPKPELLAGETLAGLLLANADRPVMLLLSGGSAFLLLQHLSIELLGQHMTIGVLDERCSTDDRVNNFAQLKLSDFYHNAKIAGAQFIDTTMDTTQSCDGVSSEWEVQLRSWKNSHPDGVVIVTMGIGEDGHTTGIMPNVSDVDFLSTAWVVSYSVPSSVNQYTDRITTTHTFLKEVVDEAIVLIKGDAKKVALNNLVNNEEALLRSPSRILHEMKSVRLFTNIDL